MRMTVIAIGPVNMAVLVHGSAGNGDRWTIGGCARMTMLVSVFMSMLSGVCVIVLMGVAVGMPTMRRICAILRLKRFRHLMHDQVHRARAAPHRAQLPALQDLEDLEDCDAAR